MQGDFLGNRPKEGLPNSNKKRPVSIDGIEFDALIESGKTLSATIPTYPIEEGFPVSDTITLDPVSIELRLFVSKTPVTWLYRHGTDSSRVMSICSKIEDLWNERKLVKIVTSDTVYTDMGITGISIRHSNEIGYAREISILAQKVVMTSKQTTDIPDDVMKSGATMANAGATSTSNESGGGVGAIGGYGTDESGEYSGGDSSGGDSSGGRSEEGSSSEEAQSTLYGMASGFGFL